MAVLELLGISRLPLLLQIGPLPFRLLFGRPVRLVLNLGNKR